MNREKTLPIAQIKGDMGMDTKYIYRDRKIRLS